MICISLLYIIWHFERYMNVLLLERVVCIYVPYPTSFPIVLFPLCSSQPLAPVLADGLEPLRQ